MKQFLTVLAVCGAIGICGCSGDTGEPIPPAEVPEAGPAVADDPGSAPGGQWEPSVESEDETAESPPAEPPPQPAETDDDATGTDEDAATSDPGVSLKLQPWEETAQLIASHQGRIVVVDFWSTSCLPCRREFPHLVELQKAHPEKLACVSVSLDYSGRKSRPPDSYRESVLQFLQKQHATLDNVLSTDDPDELYQRLELPPIPVVWVFNQSGEHVKTFDNGDLDGDEFTYREDVIPFVESLLAKN